MLTKERTSKTRKLKYAAVALALLAVLVFCFASCGKATPTGIEYVENTATKLVYNLGETFDCAGAQVKVTYANGAEETVAVTPEMVGTAPLTFGMESVTVTYSENGATVVGHIPVTVVDPNAALKADTIAKLAAGTKVVARKNDGGVALLLEDCSAKINAATSVDAITALVSNFEADLDDYIAKKDAIVAKFGDDALVKKIAQLYAQYKKDIDTAEANAKANVEAASTLAEAENYYLQFVIAVDNKLAEQKLIEDKEGGNKGQIYDKIELLYQLEDYLAKTAMYEEIVEGARAEIGEDNYKTAMDGYKAVRAKISYETKYITLAIDLSAIDLEESVGSMLVTDIDRAVEKMLAAEKVTIYPTAYKAEIDFSAFADLTAFDDTILDADNDKIAALLDEVGGLIEDAMDMFGTAGTYQLMAEYGKPDGNPDEANYINLLGQKIYNKHDELNQIREDAQNIILLIEAAAAKTSTGVAGDEQDLAIQAAWTAIKTWNDANHVFSMTGDGDKVIVANYDLDFDAVVYTATGFNGEKWTTIDETWTAYDVDKAYVVKYFIPNIDKLIKASQVRFAEQVKVAIDNDKLDEGDVFYSLTAGVNSDEEIQTARGLYEAFKAAYSADANYTELYNELFLVGGEDVYKARLEAAEATMATLKDLATKANSAINTYKELIGDNVVNIVVEDFKDGGLLKAAYDAYLDFAKANAAIENAADPAYTDVITDEAKLVAYMEQYTKLVAYVDARDVESAKTITAAWILRDDAAKADREVPQNFRAELQAFAEEMILYIKNNYNYEIPATVTVKEEQVAITAENAKFYFVEILNYNKKIVNEAAETVADYIADTTYTTDFSINPLIAGGI